MKEQKLLFCFTLKDVPNKNILEEEGQSDLQIRSCPECNEKMWMSEAKRALISNQNIFVLCNRCIIELLQEDETRIGGLIDIKDLFTKN